MSVRKAIKHASFVAGGVAIEMELSRIIKEFSRDLVGSINL